MSNLKKPRKLKNDIKIIHFVNGQEISCSYNACRDKFEEASQLITRKPKWNEYKPITSKTYFMICKECGTKLNNVGDRTKSYDSFLNALHGHDQTK